MGNKGSKNSSRGQPLGSATSPGQALGSSQSTGQRKQLVQSKSKRQDLKHKERILNVLDQADLHKKYASNPNMKYQDQSQYSNSQSQLETNKKQFGKTDESAHKLAKQKENEKLMSSSMYMSDPSSKQALAAESRIKSKQRKSNNDRRERTRDLLFGDALNNPSSDDVSSNNTNNHRSKSRSKSPTNRSKNNEKDVFIASGNAAQAALNRLESKKKKPREMKNRKQRTIDLLHGDALKGDNYYEPKPKSQSETPFNNNQNQNQNQIMNGPQSQSTSQLHLEVKTDDLNPIENEMDENESVIRAGFDEIKNDKEASKLLLRIIQDILKGKTNKVNPSKLDDKIRHVLISLGFVQTPMPNKQGQMTDYLVCNDNAMSVMRYAEQEIYQHLSFSE